MRLIFDFSIGAYTSNKRSGAGIPDRYKKEVALRTTSFNMSYQEFNYYFFINLTELV